MVNVKLWSQDQQKNYIRNSLDGFSEEQKLYMAHIILNDYEERKRMTELQGDNQTAYGDSEDERGFED